MKKILPIRHIKWFSMIFLIITLGTGCSKNNNVTLETTEITYGNLSENVTATGTIESVSQVNVGTQVTGIVSKINVDYNSIVKSGELIAEIDKTTLESELESANSTLASTKAQYEYDKKNYERDKALHAKQLISDYDFDTSLKQSQTSYAAYQKSQADRVKAARNLSYAEIYSPINGIVVAREIEVGQTVVSNMSVANLFIIADLDNMQVVANVDEADIGSIKVGQSATFTVDAFPNDTFHGTVKQVRINPTTTSNVVTYQVLISTANPEHKLIPGLTANVTIKVKEATNVLILPLKAMKFSPQEFKDNKDMPTIVDNLKKSQKHSSQKEGNTPKDPTIPTEDMHRLVWVLKDNKLIATEIEIGMDDGINGQVLSGLKKGDKVALKYNTISEESNSENTQDGSRSPFMPKRPGSEKKK